MPLTPDEEDVFSRWASLGRSVYIFEPASGQWLTFALDREVYPQISLDPSRSANKLLFSNGTYDFTTYSFTDNEFCEKDGHLGSARMPLRQPEYYQVDRLPVIADALFYSPYGSEAGLYLARCIAAALTGPTLGPVLILYNCENAEEHPLYYSLTNSLGDYGHDYQHGPNGAARIVVHCEVAANEVAANEVAANEVAVDHRTTVIFVSNNDLSFMDNWPKDVDERVRLFSSPDPNPDSNSNILRLGRRYDAHFMLLLLQTHMDWCDGQSAANVSAMTMEVPDSVQLLDC